MDSQVLVALGLSFIGGLSTSIGALFVIMNQSPSLKKLGLLQGFAAGLMLSISFFDLAHNAINSIGFLKGNLWFFAGVILFAFVVNFIPEPTLVPETGVTDKQKDDDGSGKDLMKKHRQQVLFSGIITAVGSLGRQSSGFELWSRGVEGTAMFPKHRRNASASSDLMRTWSVFTVIRSVVECVEDGEIDQIANKLAERTK